MKLKPPEVLPTSRTDRQLIIFKEELMSRSPSAYIRQARFLGISRGSVYYLPHRVSAGDLALMRRIDELHLDYPFAGSRMLQHLLKAEGHDAGRLRVSTLMKKMGDLSPVEHLETRAGTRGLSISTEEPRRQPHDKDGGARDEAKGWTRDLHSD